MAMGQDDGAVSIVTMPTLARSTTIPVVPHGQVLGIGFVPHSHLLVVGGHSGFLALVDVQRGTVTTRLTGHRGAIYAPSLSADGRLLATASDDRTVRLWTLPGGRPLGDPLRLRRFVDDVSLSPDGRRLAVTQDEKLIEIFDVRTRQRQTSLTWNEGIEFARFSPNGRRLVAGGIQGRVRLWDTATWTPVGRPLGRHAGPVLTADISRDGAMLVTASFDASARLWDLTTYEALGAPLPGQADHPAAAQFTPNGTHLIAAYDTGRAYRWDVRPATWKRQACTLAGRRLTRSEWSELLPGHEYKPIC
jgi:WD40 repeat protein